MKELLGEHMEIGLFRQKFLVLIAFLLTSVFLLFQATQLELDASFTKNTPMNHDYMKEKSMHDKSFGGVNNIFISVCNNEGDIFTSSFLSTLKKVHDKLLFIPNIENLQVKSLYSASVRFMETQEGHFSSGSVIPKNFQPNTSSIASIRSNIENANVVGSIISNDHSCTMLHANFTDFTHNNGTVFNSISLASTLKHEIKQAFENNNISIHIIGFDTVAGELSSGLKGAAVSFAISILVIVIMLYFLHRSASLSLLPVLCSLCAVVFEMGILSMLGFRLDPMLILAPAVVFIVGLFHSVQMVNTLVGHVNSGLTCHAAAQVSFKQLLSPGIVALLINMIVFITLYSIDIVIIQEFAITVTLGLAMIVLTNLLLLPLLLSYLTLPPKKRKITRSKISNNFSFWHFFAGLVTKGRAAIMLVLTAVLYCIVWLNSNNITIGDTHLGALALDEYSSYSQDVNSITNHYDQSINYLSVMVETTPNACSYYDTMNNIEQFQWRIENIEGVQSTLSLADKLKRVNEIYSERNPKWRVIPRNQQTLEQFTSHIPTSTGLLNSNCSIMSVIIYLDDHKADTIKRVIEEIKVVAAELGTKQLQFTLAPGQISALAATNELIAQAMLPILLSIYGLVAAICLFTYRSLKVAIAFTVPLVIISNLALWLLIILDIGLTVFTLPLIVLSIGLGVNHCIYILSTMNERLKVGSKVQDAYYAALKQCGKAILFTNVSLAIALSTWYFSDFAFQVNMAGLLTCILFVNILVIFLIFPALLAFLWPNKKLT